MIWKQKGVYQEDSKAVTEEKLWSCSHPPLLQIPCPLVTLIKKNIWNSDSPALLNVFAAHHGRAVWFTNNTHLTYLYCLLVLPHWNSFPLSRNNSEVPIIHWSTLMAAYRETIATWSYIVSWKAVFLLSKIYTELRKMPWILPWGLSLPKGHLLQNGDTAIFKSNN